MRYAFSKLYKVMELKFFLYKIKKFAFFRNFFSLINLFCQHKILHKKNKKKQKLEYILCLLA